MNKFKLKCEDKINGETSLSKEMIIKDRLKLVAWESTRNCNLSCLHCRASSENKNYEGELDTTEALNLMDNIAEVSKPIVIITGGEPILRKDIFTIASYGTKLGLKMVMAPNGTLITSSIASKMIESGIKRISVSIDGFNSSSHDVFRGVKGSFNAVLRGIKYVKEAGIDFQINTTITENNFKYLPKILELAENLGAIAHHIFLLVPTGRGKYIVDKSITEEEYEKILNWFYEQRMKTSLKLKATCAPHYYRILRQRAKAENIQVSFKTYGLDAVTKGCLAGTGFCFISHKGIVQPCGYMDIDCGNIKDNSFKYIWQKSLVFNKLRDLKQLKGKCGRCKYAKVCGGCRARAFEATGDYMNEEPLCSFKI